MLNDDFQQLDKIIIEHMNQVHVPAVALAVVNEQEILYAKGYGSTSVEEGGVPVSPRTLFRSGSVTKPLVATSVLRLVDWLRFSVSDDGIIQGICIPNSETQFSWSGGLIEFQIAADGTVPALTARKVYEFRRI